MAGGCRTIYISSARLSRLAKMAIITELQTAPETRRSEPADSPTPSTPTIPTRSHRLLLTPGRSDTTQPGPDRTGAVGYIVRPNLSGPLRCGLDQTGAARPAVRPSGFSRRYCAVPGSPRHEGQVQGHNGTQTAVV